MEAVYVLQKQTDGIQNAYYFNVMAFKSKAKAIEYCLIDLKLKPLKMNGDVKTFTDADIQLFAEVNKYGIKDEQKVKSNYHRIIKLEVV